MNRIEVLNAIWSRSRGDNVFLPMFQKGIWHESDPFTIAQAALMAPFLAATDGDRYFSPLRYNGARRRGAVGQPGVIFADLDGAVLYDRDLAPSILIETSDGHYHGYWFLDKPYDAMEWEPHAKGWSQWIGADEGGWDVTQVLRLPDSLNHKHDPPEQVKVVRYNTELVYPLSAFPSATMVRTEGAEDRPVGDTIVSHSILSRGLDLGTIPLSAVYWLTSSVEDIEALGKIDRSKVMWQIERALFENGYTDDEVFHLMRMAGVNKWKGDDNKLWREVQKASAA